MGEVMMQQATPTSMPDGNEFRQQAMIRGAMLQYLAASQLAPEELLELAHNYATVIHWEELLCAAIDAEAGHLLAVVGIHRPNGYSGLFRRHGSIEYVRFFIDWEDGRGYRPVSLAHFKVCDRPPETIDMDRSRYWRVTTLFNRERYWGCVINGRQPKVKAVLSWNFVPQLDPGFTPLFGNSVESTICIESGRELMQLIRQNQQNADGIPITPQDIPQEIYTASLH
jgi:hypothetical protein